MPKKKKPKTPDPNKGWVWCERNGSGKGFWTNEVVCYLYENKRGYKQRCKACKKGR